MGLTVLVLADTHLRSGTGRWLPPPVVDELHRADAVLHAGDVLDAGVLDRLRAEAGSGRPDASAPAPVYAVLGNNDGSLGRLLPPTRTLELAGVRIGMIHDSGPRIGREARIGRMFPDCQVVVFGHSHVPVASSAPGGQLLFNPGSPTQRRAQPAATYGVLRLEGGMVKEHRILTV